MYAWSVDPCHAISPVELDKDGETTEIHYWRKHHDLHGWMHRLYLAKGGQEEFNCVPVELTEEDLNNLATALEAGHLPKTTGFFFGNNPPDEDTIREDMDFIQKARNEIKDGQKVYYYSWW